MRKMLFLFILISPIILFATRYSVSIKKEGDLYHVSGTNHYLKIPGCYRYGYTQVIIDTAIRRVYIEKSYYYGSDKKYDTYYYTSYEKLFLPAGTIDQNGILIFHVYTPKIIH